MAKILLQMQVQILGYCYLIIILREFKCIFYAQQVHLWLLCCLLCEILNTYIMYSIIITGYFSDKAPGP